MIITIYTVFKKCIHRFSLQNVLTSQDIKKKKLWNVIFSLSLTHYIFFSLLSSLFSLGYLSPRRGYRRDPKFCMWSFVITKNQKTNIWDPHFAIFGWKRGVFWKGVLGFWNFRYDFLGVWEDVWRWLYRHSVRKYLLYDIIIMQ